MKQALSEANRRFDAAFPGDTAARQPVHTVYGGAHLFQAESALKLGALAENTLKTHAPDAASLGGCLGLPEALREAVYSRLLAKLKREPVEYFQIDFEDGYGNRSEAEEDRHAVLAGSVFDDAATGQGLLNYFLRAYDCGAITEEETLRSGLTLEELRSQSFLKILEGRRTHATG